MMLLPRPGYQLVSLIYCGIEPFAFDLVVFTVYSILALTS